MPVAPQPFSSAARRPGSGGSSDSPSGLAGVTIAHPLTGVLRGPDLPFFPEKTGSSSILIQPFPLADRQSGIYRVYDSNLKPFDMTTGARKSKHLTRALTLEMTGNSIRLMRGDKLVVPEVAKGKSVTLHVTKKHPLQIIVTLSNGKTSMIVMAPSDDEDHVYKIESEPDKGGSTPMMPKEAP